MYPAYGKPLTPTMNHGANDPDSNPGLEIRFVLLMAERQEKSSKEKNEGSFLIKREKMTAVEFAMKEVVT